MLTLISGASSGLGAEMARQLADLGHDLVLAARRVDRLEELRAEILAKHPTLTVAVAELDVTDDDAVFRVFADHGSVDRIIVNAGLDSSEPVGTGHHSRNRAVAMTNFVAALAQMEAAMEQFRSSSAATSWSSRPSPPSVGCAVARPSTLPPSAASLTWPRACGRRPWTPTLTSGSSIPATSAPR